MKHKQKNLKILLIILVSMVVGAGVGFAAWYFVLRNDAELGGGDDFVCPAGKYKVCAPLAGGEKSCGCHSEPNVALKPLIYLYPETETETEVTVRLGRPENLTVSYPEYGDGWRVMARPDGSLTNLNNGRELYGLYWEGLGEYDMETDGGFVVAGAETAEFLEEKLAILGLNEREAEEFIIYWLPKLERNDYNFIRFATAEEIEENMALMVTPAPETTIRVMMLYRATEEPFAATPQTLTTPTREGFTVVEWGGSEISKR